MKMLYEVVGILAVGALVAILVNFAGWLMPFMKLPSLSLGDGTFIGWLAIGLGELKDGVASSFFRRSKDDE